MYCIYHSKWRSKQKFSAIGMLGTEHTGILALLGLEHISLT